MARTWHKRWVGKLFHTAGRPSTDLKQASHLYQMLSKACVTARLTHNMSAARATRSLRSYESRGHRPWRSRPPSSLPQEASA